MKLRILLTFLFLNFTSILFSQETANPLTDTKIMRKVSRIDIEGKVYENVEVTLKSISPDYFVSDKHKVKVVVEDMNGTKIWKKNLKNVFLYVFSNGQIQVGKQNFNKILILKDDLGEFYGKIRVKEGIY